METMSASPSASTCSATSGVLMRLVVISGIFTSPRSLAVTLVKAARGTLVAMVGMRASCQPMPVLMRVAPAASMALARVTISSQVLPPSTRSSMDRRKMMMKFGPTASRTRRTISTARRMRFS
ncbi:hypothetical protein D9M68_422590 [compost metagenome]